MNRKFAQGLITHIKTPGASLKCIVINYILRINMSQILDNDTVLNSFMVYGSLGLKLWSKMGLNVTERHQTRVQMLVPVHIINCIHLFLTFPGFKG